MNLDRTWRHSGRSDAALGVFAARHLKSPPPPAAAIVSPQKDFEGDEFKAACESHNVQKREDGVKDPPVSPVVPPGCRSAGLIGIPAASAGPGALCRVGKIKAAQIRGV